MTTREELAAWCETFIGSSEVGPYWQRQLREIAAHLRAPLPSQRSALPITQEARDLSGRSITHEPEQATLAMRTALEVLDECVTYVESPSWSPSMANECKAAADKLRAALAAQEKEAGA